MYVMQTPTHSNYFSVLVSPPQPKVFDPLSEGRGKRRNSEEIDRLPVAIKEYRVISGRYPLPAEWKRLEALYDLPENWNGYEVDKPDPNAIEKARKWLGQLYADVSSSGRSWYPPHITANEDGAVVFEWAKRQKRLSIYISDTECWYLQSWGLDILEEMRDGDLTKATECFAIWSWMQE